MKREKVLIPSHTALKRIKKGFKNKLLRNDILYDVKFETCKYTIDEIKGEFIRNDLLQS